MDGDLLRTPVPLGREHHPFRPRQPAHPLCPPDARGGREDTADRRICRQQQHSVEPGADLHAGLLRGRHPHHLRGLDGEPLPLAAARNEAHGPGTARIPPFHRYRHRLVHRHLYRRQHGDVHARGHRRQQQLHHHRREPRPLHHGRQDPCRLYHHGGQSPPAVRYRLPEARLRPRAALHQLVRLR